MDANIGQDIASLCSKCGESWHVVISMLKEKIAKVECKQCHGVHRYKDPQAAQKKAAAKKATKRRSPAKKAGGVPPLVEADLNKPVQSYSVKGSFEPGDRIQHSSFGVGVVQYSPGPGKVEILFGEDRKLLAQAKPAIRSLFE